MASITSSNSVIMIRVTNLIAAPVQIQGFSADDIFSTEAIDTAETMMGVDGNLSAGFIYVAIKWNIMLMANSPSNFIFDNIYAAEQQIKEKYQIQGVVVLPSIGTKWNMKNGILTSFQPMPDAKKVLQPRKFGITWESVSPALVS